MNLIRNFESYIGYLKKIICLYFKCKNACIFASLKSSVDIAQSLRKGLCKYYILNFWYLNFLSLKVFQKFICYPVHKHRCLTSSLHCFYWLFNTSVYSNDYIQRIWILMFYVVNFNYKFAKRKYVKTEKIFCQTNFFVLLRFNVNSNPDSCN